MTYSLELRQLPSLIFKCFFVLKCEYRCVCTWCGCQRPTLRGESSPTLFLREALSCLCAYSQDSWSVSFLTVPVSASQLSIGDQQLTDVYIWVFRWAPGIHLRSCCVPSTITGQAISLARDNYFLRGHKRLHNTTVRIPHAVLICIYIVQCSNQGRHA